jgi:uncharacterized membrane protein YgcG
MGFGRFATFMRVRNFLIALPLAALAIAGCGGDDGGEETATTPAVTTTAAPSLSKEELIAQGDAICAEVNAALAAVSANTASADSQVTQVADLYIGMVESLRGLGTPDGDDAGYDEVMSAADDLAQAESDAKLADERGDSAALSTAQTEATSAVIAFQGAAATYGFQSCSQGPGVSATAPSPPTTPTTPTTPSTTPTTPAPAPNTGGAGGTAGSTGGGSAGGGTGSGGSTGGGSSGGIGPG